MSELVDIAHWLNANLVYGSGVNGTQTEQILFCKRSEEDGNDLLQLLC